MPDQAEKGEESRLQPACGLQMAAEGAPDRRRIRLRERKYPLYSLIRGRKDGQEAEVRRAGVSFRPPGIRPEDR